MYFHFMLNDVLFYLYPVHQAFGATVTALEIGAEVTHVEENTPAFKAGLRVGDILLALDHWQVSVDKLSAMFDA
jgi:predicted metalloprotease with PDZ domain